MKILKRILFSLIFLCALLILAVIVYCFIPLEKTGVNNFTPRGESAFLKLSLDNKNISLADDIIDFRFAEEFVAGSAAKRMFLKAGARFFSPITATVLADKDDEPDEFEYIILLQSSKASRFAQIPFSVCSASSSFRDDYAVEQVSDWKVYKSKDDNCDLKAFAVRGDAWLFMIKADNIDEIIERIDADKLVQSSSSGSGFEQFLSEKKDELFLLHINDEDKILDFYLAEAKEKTSCDFFPSFSDLDEIFICFGSVSTQHKRSGEMNFYFEKDADLQKARKDIWFLSQVLKRMFEANFYGYEYEIETIENEVAARFALTKTRR